MVSIPRRLPRRAAASLALAVAASTLSAQQPPAEPDFPVAAELFVDGEFGGCEGIAFNGEGRLFVTAGRRYEKGEEATAVRGLWEVALDGSVRKVADVETTLGVAGFGGRDLLVADFGPTSAFREDRNTDGVVWRITPEGEKTAWVTGIGDPNFVVVRRDGSLLVSDDATSDVYVVGEDRAPRLFTTSVPHPNGMVLSADERTLWVAQIFKSIRPVVYDDSLWALALDEEGRPTGAAELVARTGPWAANDGLAMDAKGRVYVAANGRAGEIWRYDPASGEMTLVARDVYGAASLAFGEGEFDRESIYVTTTFNGGRGGKVWRVPVGVEGAPLHR